jgi:putative hemolysin
LSALFSGSECAIFSLKESELNQLREKPGMMSKSLLSLLENKNNCLIVILIGNLIVNIMLSAMVSEAAMKFFGEVGLPYAIVVVTLLLLVFGEVTPKTIALKNAKSLALLSAPFLVLVRKIVSPLIEFLESISDFLMKLLCGEDEEEHLSADELSTMVSLGAREGVFNPWEKKLIHQIFDFKEVFAVERMTPRPDVFAVDIHSSKEELETLLSKVSHSKIPVYEGELDYIVGYFQMKDFLLFPEKSLSEILHPVHIVPEMKPIDKLLEEMQNKKIKMAVLLDEYANTQGIITMRDVLETLFGHLSSPHQEGKNNITPKGEGIYRILGATSLRELNQHFEIVLFDEDYEEADTIAGFFLSEAELNRLPLSGDKLVMEEYTLEVKKVIKRRIMELELSFPEIVSPGELA